jgi:hypothetical protein
MGAWYVPQRLARYRLHGDNETSVGGERFAKPGIYIYSRLVADQILEDIKPELRARLLRAHYLYGIYLLKNGHTNEARKHFLAAMPIIRAILALALSCIPQIVRSSAFDCWRRIVWRVAPTFMPRSLTAATPEVSLLNRDATHPDVPSKTSQSNLT